MFHNVRLSESRWNVTKTLGSLAVAITFAFLFAAGLSTTAFAQQSSYNYGYYTNANTTGVPDAEMYIVNPGSTGGTSPSGDLCANIYVFNSAQQMMECCSCKVTPDALTTFSLNANLTNNPLTGSALQTGAIKIVSSAVPAEVTSVPTSAPTSCKNVASSTYTPSGYLGIWITHVHVATGTNGTTYSTSEMSFLPGRLSTPHTAAANAELTQLQKICKYVSALTESGYGICTCPSTTD